MSWISALTPLQWGLLSLVPIGITLLYFLKLRREPVEVPSTFLWARTIEDLHVNSLLQRLRRSLLLFLQLAAVAIAAIALLRPGAGGKREGLDRKVFLLDTSASMQARDVDGASSRFELAKQLIGQQIDQMTDNETAMLVTFSDRPDTLQSFTSDRRRLADALQRVQVTNFPTDILGALKAADGLANPRRSSEVGNMNDVQVASAMPADLLIYSDGGFQPVTEFNLGNLVPRYTSIGSVDPANLAITAFSAERNLDDPSQVQAFATVANLGSQDLETTATLTLDGEFLDASAISLEPGEQTGLTFSIDSNEAIQLVLRLDVDDDLPVDNVAYAGLSPLRNVRVLVVTPGNTPLELGLGTPLAAKICISEFVSPDYLSSDAYRQRAKSGTDDLIIYDRCRPDLMPETNTFFIASLPSQPADQVPGADSTNAQPDSDQPDSDQPVSDQPDAWSWASQESGVALIDVDRTHPMMRYLELFSLLIYRGRAIQGPPGTTQLVEADIGSVLSLAPREGYQDMVLGFPIVDTTADGASSTNTNWYAERSWPVFMLNVLRYLAGAAEATGAPSHQPGSTVRVRLDNSVGDVTLIRTNQTGNRQFDPLPLPPSGTIEIVDTDQPGNYQMKSADRVADSFAINLFDTTESSLAVASDVELGYEAIAGTQGSIDQRREYWRLLLLAMLMTLAIEWWLYNRRLA